MKPCLVVSGLVFFFFFSYDICPLWHLPVATDFPAVTQKKGRETAFKRHTFTVRRTHGDIEAI